MKRQFPYITVGKVLDELNEELKEEFLERNPEAEEDEVPELTRVTYYRLEKRLGFPTGKRTQGELQWRVYTPEQKEKIKEMIKEEYNFA